MVKEIPVVEGPTWALAFRTESSNALGFEDQKPSSSHLPRQKRICPSTLATTQRRTPLGRVR